MDEANEIGANLKAFRERMSLSQDEVAKYLGIQRELVSYYESGARKAPQDTLEKLAKLFGVDLYDLMQPVGTASAKVNVAFAFRATGLSNEDLDTIADFKKIVRNYLKLVDLKNKDEREF